MSERTFLKAGDEIHVKFIFDNHESQKAWFEPALVIPHPRDLHTKEGQTFIKELGELIIDEVEKQKYRPIRKIIIQSNKDS